MLFMMLIGLYTSRVILQTLGVADYGTYNVVGGVIAMFSILTSSLSSAISRFITFELGRGDHERLNKVFSTAVNVQLILGLVIVLLTETIGVWFLNTHMNIPEGRMVAANWVLQCVIVSFVLGMQMVPYNATLIAHENMNIFAYITILEAVLKLTVAFSLYMSPFDKLITYAVLLLAVSFLIRGIYAAYCKRHYAECTYHFVYDKPLLKEMTGFAGWNFLGDGSWILNTQGVNMLINIYFGVTLNAARGIAVQVDGIVQNFSRNIIVAINPQITKSYAAGNLYYMHKLIMFGAKFSFFLIMFFSIPICLETDTLLALWLNMDNLPQYTPHFVRLSLLSTLCITLGGTLVTAVCATGKMKKYEICVGVTALMIFPLTFIAFYFGASPISAYIINCVVYFILIFVRLFIVKDYIHISASMYVRNVIGRSICTLIFALPLPWVFHSLIDNSILRLVTVSLVSAICSIGAIWSIGINRMERGLITSAIRNKFRVK